MTNITNAKIEKIDAAIAATKKKLSYYQAKLRELERERRVEEDNEIVALFRNEDFTEADLALLRHMKARQAEQIELEVSDNEA